MNHDPGRLTDTDTGALGDLLRGARSDSLDGEAIARIRGGLTAAGVVAAATGAASDASALAKSTSTWGGMFTTAAAKIGIAVLVVGVAGGAALLASRHSPSSTPRVAVTGAVPSFSPSSDMATELPSPAPEPLAPPPPETKKSATKAAVASALLPTTPPTSSAPSANEGALLLQARRVLESDPARALALVQEHASEFPKSQLAPERDRIAAEARKLLHP